MKINPYQRIEKGQPAATQAEAGGKPAPAGRGAGSLIPGQLLKGRVVGVEENGRVLLAIDKEVITARTPLRLAKGDVHWLEVRRGGAEPWLVLAGRKGAAGELLRLLATEDAGLGKALELLLGPGTGQDPVPAAASSLLQALTALLADSAAGGEADPARIILSTLLLQEPSGRQGEGGRLHRQLADLLAVLPEETSGRKEGENLARILAAMGKVNAQPAAADNRFLLFPIWLGGAAGWGEWLFTPDDRGEAAAGEAGYELSFFMHLSGLGELHLNLAVRGEAIRGTFAAASKEARHHLEDNLPELTGLLHQLGFNQVRLSCRPAERHLLHELQETLRRRAGLAPLALVDLQA